MLEYRKDYRTYRGPELRSETKLTTTVWIGKRNARLDRQDESVILNGDEGKIYFVDHGEKIWQELSLPVRLEDHLSAEQRRFFAEHGLESQPATITPQGEETIGEWAVEGYLLEATTGAPRATKTVEVWNTAEVDFDRSAYDELRRNEQALNPAVSPWVDQFLALPGLTVRQKIVSTQGARRSEVTTELIAVEERTAVEGLYTPPKGYRQTPFDVSKYVQIHLHPR